MVFTWATLEQTAVMPFLRGSIGDGNAIADTARSTLELPRSSSAISKAGLRLQYVVAAAAERGRCHTPSIEQRTSHTYRWFTEPLRRHD